MCAYSSVEFSLFPSASPLLPLFHYYSRRVNPWRLPSNIICCHVRQRRKPAKPTAQWVKPNQLLRNRLTHTQHTLTHTQRECATNPQLIIYGFCLLDSYIFQGKLWQDCLCVRACVCLRACIGVALIMLAFMVAPATADRHPSSVERALPVSLASAWSDFNKIAKACR